MKKFNNISYLRVVACLGIVITHMQQRVNLEGGKLYELTHYFQHGVYLFFIISGFLGAYTYMNKSYRPAQYWKKRLIRILPVYYAVVLYSFIVHGLILADMPEDASGLGWLRYLLVIQQYVPGEQQWRNICFTWTLCVFVLFYLLVPFICKWVRSFRASLVALLLTYMGYVALEKVIGYAQMDKDYFTPVFYLIYFMLGVVICYAVREHKENTLAVIYAFIMLYYFAMSKYNSPYTLSLLFSIIVIASLPLTFHHPMIVKCFEKLDKFSYEIYLGHAIVMDMIDIIALTAPLAAPVVIALGVVGTTAVSVFLYYCVDMPAVQWLSARMSGKDRRENV